MQPCPGLNRVSDNRKWYTPNGKSTTSCTYCEECFTKNIKGTPSESSFYCSSSLHNCNCDYPRDYSKVAVEKGDIRIYVKNPNGTIYSKVEDTLANLNGVMHVCVPTCAEYHIVIENLKSTSDKHSYITFESGKVGDKRISINNGSRIYYPLQIVVKGFQTGTSESFMFKSLSDREKGEGKSLEGENTTNVISLNIQQWKETPATSRYMYMGDRDSSDFFGSSTRTRGGGESYSKGGYDRGDSGESMKCMANSSSRELSGGATVSGGSYVDNVRTSTTNSTFTKVGEAVEFLVQLVCNQSDEEKYAANRAYDLKIQYEKREALLSRKRQHEKTLESLKADQEREMSKLSKLEEELEQFKDLGSYVKEDYLVRFK